MAFSCHILRESYDWIGNHNSKFLDIRNPKIIRMINFYAKLSKTILIVFFKNSHCRAKDFDTRFEPPLAQKVYIIRI